MFTSFTKNILSLGPNKFILYSCGHISKHVALVCYFILTIWSCDVEVGNIYYPHQEKP